MKTLLFLLEKEFRQILRNKGIIRMILMMPVMQMILLPLAADFSVKNIALTVVDHDHSSYSQKLISKITSSGHFKLTGYDGSYKQALDDVENDKSDLVLEIPAGFEKDLVRENSQKVYIAINAIEGTKANLGGGYLGSIIAAFNGDIRMKWMDPTKTSPLPTINIVSTNWYNPYMDFHQFIVPAILVMLLTAIGSMQAAFNIVQEKESGTIEQINVTPIKKHIFILGKLIPFLILSIIVFSLGLGIARLFYGVVSIGSYVVLYSALVVYLFAMLGLGLLVSTYSETQQQAMSLSFFFINIFNLMSGFFTSVDSMPAWAQTLVQLFPVSHFIKIVRMVVLKASDFQDIAPKLLAMFLIGLVLNTWAVINYRKTNN